MAADVKLDLDDLFRKIIGEVGNRDYVIAVSNKTGAALRRVDAYNDSQDWPLFDMEPGESAGKLRSVSFSFAAKYEGGGHTFVLAASSPFAGHNKIDLSTTDTSCKSVWDKMDDGHDKSTPGGSRAAIMTDTHGAKFWYFELKG